MRINYNITGEKRKSLVNAISQELNLPIKYLGVPTFAYEVGGYRINKNGMLEGEDNFSLVADLCGLHSFQAVSEEYDAPMTYEESLGGLGATPSIEELNNEAELWAEREMRRMKLEYENVPDYSNRGQYGGDDIPAFEELQMTEEEEFGLGKQRHDPRGEDGMQESDIPETDETDRLTIEMPIEGFADTALINLDRLIAGKAALIKKAIDADDLPVERTETTLRFPWFRFGIEPEEVKAYARFIGALCAMAKKQKRVTATEKAYDNERYAFRCFLLRLGFIGPEYKEERKVLLSKLTGSAAFKNSSEEATEA